MYKKFFRFVFEPCLLLLFFIFFDYATTWSFQSNNNINDSGQKNSLNVGSRSVYYTILKHTDAGKLYRSTDVYEYFTVW